MGIYFNPGNNGFAEMLRSDYVDKTGMIALINQTIGTKKKLTCVSRPRRFGKSYAAQMLAAYYDCSCDSRPLFSGLDIEKQGSYEDHVNRYNVIFLDIAGFLSRIRSERRPMDDVTNLIIDTLRDELSAAHPGLTAGGSSLSVCFHRIVEGTEGKPGRKFVFIIDEWDAVIREAKDRPDIQEAYLDLLRGWFKDVTFTPKVVAAAYMTGILPIKKDGSQSAISDFQEYSMLDPQRFATYVGFTEEEVRRECERLGGNFENMKRWYDGYSVGDCHSIYNPYSVMQSIYSGKYRSFWKKTAAAETLMTYIDLDQDGLQDDIARLIAGEAVEVDPESFQNDVETFTCKDDVLTLLIHLGYLTYEEIPGSYDESDDGVITGMARIPNEEVRTEFEKILRKAKHGKLIELVNRSDRLLSDTIACREEEVARAITEIHDSEYAPTFYNNEKSLRYVVKLGYLSCVDQYAKVEELPSGHGIADVSFIPKKRSPLPALLIELKWNKSSIGAIRQMKDGNYPVVFRNYCGEVILVGINYDEKTKRHTCKIERIRLGS